MDFEKWLANNPDWRPYVEYVVKPPLPEELMTLFPGDVCSEMLARCLESVWEGGGHVTRGTIYIRVRTEDKKTKYADQWATMLALQAPPGIQTSDTFWAGRRSWVQCYGEDYANRTKKALAAKGVVLKPGDEYAPELARHPNDPEAVIPFAGARSYIKSLCEKRGWAAEGAVTVKHREPERDPYENSVPMAPDLIRKKACAMVRANPDLRRKTKKDLAAMVLEKHGPSK